MHVISHVSSCGFLEERESSSEIGMLDQSSKVQNAKICARCPHIVWCEEREKARKAQAARSNGLVVYAIFVHHMLPQKGDHRCALIVLHTKNE